MRRKKLGISEVTATVLLAAVTISVSVGVYLWASGYLSSLTSAVTGVIERGEREVVARIQVVHVDISPVTGGYNLTIYVLNTGKTVETIDVVYVNNTVPDTYTPTKLRLAPGQLGKVVAIKYVTTARAFLVKVASRYAVSNEYLVKVP
ncbi:MAG: hypothetical protein DRJ40_11225 [Thermoprotei archaeon]|nr:MAG: hypothetical protein DRJ40_11225 [Thermoprotei archaeon]